MDMELARDIYVREFADINDVEDLGEMEFYRDETVHGARTGLPADRQFTHSTPNSTAVPRHVRFDNTHNTHSHSSDTGGSGEVIDAGVKMHIAGMPEQRANRGIPPDGLADLIPQSSNHAATGTKRARESDSSNQSNNQSPARKVIRPTETSMNESVVVRNLATEFGDDDDEDAAMGAAEFSTIEKL
jgi:hypothetical protein